MLPIIQIGPAAFPVPGLVFLAGIWIGLVFAERFCETRNVSPSDLNNLVFISLVSGFVGARLGYVIRYSEIFLDNPLSIISLRPVLLDPLFGGLVALITAWIYVQKKNILIPSILDALTPFFAVMAIAIGLSHLASGAAFGSLTNLPWAINLWGEMRHPTQIYEVILAILVLLSIYPLRGPLRTTTPGVTFLRFLLLTAISILIQDAFRGDSRLFIDGFRTNQVIAWFVLAASLIGLGLIQYKTDFKMKESKDDKSKYE